MTPSGVSGPPSIGRGRLERCAVKRTLSSLTDAPRSEGACPPRVRQKRDRILVSSRKRASPSPNMSPNASATTRASSCFSAMRRPSVPRAPMAPGSTGSIDLGGPRRVDATLGNCGDRRAAFPHIAEVTVDFDVVSSHGGCGEAPFEHAPNHAAVQRPGTNDSGCGFLLRRDDKPGYALVDDLRHRAATPGDNRSATGHRFDHHKAEGLRPIDREEKRGRVAEELGLLIVVDLADKLHGAVDKERRYDLGEICIVHRVDLGRDLELEPQALRNGDRPVRPLLGRNSTEECEVTVIWLGRDAV